MLVLTRKISEEIMIGDDIRIRFLGQKGGQIALGFQAPSEIKVHRREIYERIRDGVPKTDADITQRKSSTIKWH